MSLNAGSQIYGNRDTYTIENTGSKAGGMSIVHFGRSSNGTRVVIKEAKKVGDRFDSLRYDKLVVEAHVLNQLNHRNIVRYVDESSRLNDFYLVEEMVSGEEMWKRFHSTPADEKFAREQTNTLVNALGYLHNQNIIHRDVNPHNLILEAARSVVLIDFGTAKQGYTQFTAQGGVIGTPGFSAPEQFDSGQVTESSDVYAAGAVLFFLLTGRQPAHYMVDQLGRLQFLRSDGSLKELPHQLNPLVSEDASEIVRIAMNADQDDRFRTTSEMGAALARGLPTTSTEVSTYPYIVLQGIVFPIRGHLEIGRAHTCAADCVSRGFTQSINAPINDSARYVSSHHARIFVDSSERCWIEDLGSVNGTAISRDSGRTYTYVQPRTRQQLQDGDFVATAYKADKGPYMQFTFKEY